MKKRKLFTSMLAALALLVFLVVLIVPMLPTKADTVSSLQNKLEAAQKAKEKAQNELSGVQSEIKDVKAKRQSLDKDISALENELASIEGQIAENEKQISATQTELENAEAEAEAYDDTFKTRVRAMYERGSVSYLQIIFGAEGFADLLKRLELVSQIVEHDREVLQNMEKAQQKIRDKKNTLEENNRKVLLTREIQQNKKAELDANKEALSTVISKLQSDEATYRTVLDEADAAEEALRQEIRDMTSSSSNTTPQNNAVYSGGAFQWPTPSTTNITSPFGVRFHPIQKRNKMHTGIDIGAGYGASILAAESGTVLRAGWNSGYGNYVVIDHGSGLQTLYGHCSVLKVSSGQSVSRGQQIALVGSTGNSTGPHLHFEVLKRGSYVDPMGYFG